MIFFLISKVTDPKISKACNEDGDDNDRVPECFVFG